MRKLLLGCGFVAALLYLGMITLIRYDGYNLISQVPSELTAIGAPTRELWAWLGWVYMALTLAFGWGVWKSAEANRPLRIVGALLLVSGLLGFLWPFAPMHQREVLAAGGGTFGDTLHKILGVGTVLLFVLTVGFGTAAFGARFRTYSVATMVLALVFGMLTGIQSPRVGANLPTPYIGLFERISIAVYMIWLMALAIMLLRRQSTGSSASERPALREVGVTL
ncbi:MAG TPA: DUF998 domain-containing protein [Gemmatimonadales bacterium]|nr:DUF998 domain-containing protein [Gemmatimonadales bacterium]